MPFCLLLINAQPDEEQCILKYNPVLKNTTRQSKLFHSQVFNARYINICTLHTELCFVFFEPYPTHPTAPYVTHCIHKNATHSHKTEHRNTPFQKEFSDTSGQKIIHIEIQIMRLVYSFFNPLAFVS